jgi:hypothetical protein
VEFHDTLRSTDLRVRKKRRPKLKEKIFVTLQCSGCKDVIILVLFTLSIAVEWYNRLRNYVDRGKPRKFSVRIANVRASSEYKTKASPLQPTCSVIITDDVTILYNSTRLSLMLCRDRLGKTVRTYEKIRDYHSAAKRCKDIFWKANLIFLNTILSVVWVTTDRVWVIGFIDFFTTGNYNYLIVGFCILLRVYPLMLFLKPPYATMLIVPISTTCFGPDRWPSSGKMIQR